MFLYKPPPTVRQFILDESEIKAIIGPLGSGKTTGALFELLRRSSQQAPNSDGVRLTRFAIIRNTLPQIKQTVLADIKAYFGKLAHHKVSDGMVVIDQALDDGTRMFSEWLLTPLDQVEDVRKLLSLQLTGAFIEEFRELDFSILKPLQGRIGRYPRLGVTPTWKGIIMVSNPYPHGSEWEEAFEVVKPKGWVLYRQPSGLSPEAENIENLPKDYYANLMEGANPEWIKVHVHGENGADKSGQAVFGEAFIWTFHSAPTTTPIEGRTYIIGMDVDRHPAALIAQMDPVGRLIVHKEIYGEGIGLEGFIKGRLTPTMYQRFTGSAYIIADPSGVKRSSVSEESSFDVMERLGYEAVRAPTNEIAARLRAGDALFGAQIAGGPAVTISRSGCPMLIRALQSEYKFKRRQDGALNPIPDKLHPWSDLVDALTYMALGFNAGQIGRPIGSRRALHRTIPAAAPVSPLGWT